RWARVYRAIGPKSIRKEINGHGFIRWFARQFDGLIFGRKPGAKSIRQRQSNARGEPAPSNCVNDAAAKWRLRGSAWQVPSGRACAARGFVGRHRTKQGHLWG